MAHDEQTSGHTGHAGVNEAGHPTAFRYVQIALILAVLTGFEVWVYYQTGLRQVLTPVLLVLSAIKFALVVLFFMHLKFDNRLFSMLFTLGLLIAGSVLISLILLFHSYLFVF